jgi:diguanylate cyclase (GGDEF)-like protein
MTALPDREIDPGRPDPLLPEPTGWTDPLTGMDGPRLWDRIVSSEQARMRRFGEQVTVLLLEVSGFDDLASWVGREVALQAFARFSHVIAGEIRSSDHIARIGTNRFAVLLIETDEVKTLNFFDRVQRACMPEVESLGGLIHIGVGWSSPSPKGSLIEAIALAEERLAADFFLTRGEAAGAG